MRQPRSESKFKWTYIIGTTFRCVDIATRRQIGEVYVRLLRMRKGNRCRTRARFEALPCDWSTVPPKSVVRAGLFHSLEEAEAAVEAYYCQSLERQCASPIRKSLAAG